MDVTVDCHGQCASYPTVQQRNSKTAFTDYEHEILDGIANFIYGEASSSRHPGYETNSTTQIQSLIKIICDDYTNSNHRRANCEKPYNLSGLNGYSSYTSDSGFAGSFGSDSSYTELQPLFETTIKDIQCMDTGPLTPPLSQSDCCFPYDISLSPSSAGPPASMTYSLYKIPLPDNFDKTLAYGGQPQCPEESVTLDDCDTTLVYGGQPLCHEERKTPDSYDATFAYGRQTLCEEESSTLVEYPKRQCDGIPHLDQLSIPKCHQTNQRKKPGRKKGQVSNVYHLWEFVRDQLDKNEDEGLVAWETKSDGVFRILDSKKLATSWGDKKNNKKKMTYEKMSRSIRYSRNHGYFSTIPRDGKYPRKLCFQFGPRTGEFWK